VRVAAACASGAVKGVFVHGVLETFHERGVPIHVYAAASSSTVPAAFAAARRLADLGGAAYWQRGAEKLRELGDVSGMVRWGIAQALPFLEAWLFEPGARRFLLAASLVTTPDAAGKTQGDGARRLGLDQLRAMQARDPSWAHMNLACRLFDTMAETSTRPLTKANLADALYATTRMLHAWKTPGWIEGTPYIDASYTCVCPAIEVAELGYDCVIAISPEPGPLFRDLYQSMVIPADWNGARIHVIQPPVDLKEVGVDYLSATEDGLSEAFQMGRDAGSAFVETGDVPTR
jgi:hypothetical protein